MPGTAALLLEALPSCLHEQPPPPPHQRVLGSGGTPPRMRQEVWVCLHLPKGDQSFTGDEKGAEKSALNHKIIRAILESLPPYDCDSCHLCRPGSGGHGREAPRSIHYNRLFICPGPDPGSEDGLESEQVGQKLALEELTS